MATGGPLDAADPDGTLAPNYRLPLALVAIAIGVALVQPWLGGAMALFALFLTYQTATIRLQFTATALDVYRAGNCIRRFPYTDWQNWRIFWARVPILFYFRETRSIHFLPILFDPKRLRACLTQHCPHQ
ncbi:MAG: DUF3119 domain-containing protein [Cyanobacteria bacterium QS_8_64_29]|nr:MAG: DUF3119 domain-containing protein [Cyanobacteria bacterium QS_8_64_29]